MNLTLEQLQAIARGTDRVVREADGVHFRRMTPEQEQVHLDKGPDWLKKAQATTGVRLHFRTDSTSLKLQIRAASHGRTYFSFDVWVNGETIGHLDNFSHLDMSGNYADRKYPILDTYEKTFDLGMGEKEVCIFFPWNMDVTLQEFSLDDGAKIVPVLREKKILFFGDSITMGFDAKRPSMSYTARLARSLGAEEFNLATGGAVTWPALAAARGACEPDYIVVAYGTNDWSLSEEEVFRRDYRKLHEILQSKYPGVPVFALTPIWRTEETEIRKLGEFTKSEQIITETLADFPQVKRIWGYEFLPRDIKWFGDLRLHPSDAGFAHYFENLKKEMGI